MGWRRPCRRLFQGEDIGWAQGRGRSRVAEGRGGWRARRWSAACTPEALRAPSRVEATALVTERAPTGGLVPRPEATPRVQVVGWAHEATAEISVTWTLYLAGPPSEAPGDQVGTCAQETRPMMCTLL